MNNNKNGALTSPTSPSGVRFEILLEYKLDSPTNIIYLHFWNISMKDITCYLRIVYMDINGRIGKIYESDYYVTLSRYFGIMGSYKLTTNCHKCNRKKQLI